MSSMESKRITELEAANADLLLRVKQLELSAETTIADLLLRVKQLELSAARNSHAPSPPPSPTPAPTSTTPPTPAPTPPLMPTQTPKIPTERATASPMSAPHQKHPLPAKPLYKKPLPQKPKDTILYDVNVPRPNGAEIVHLKYIQTLHAEGVPKEGICQQTMDKFPDLCTGGSDKSRQARVWNEVEMNTSRWAVQYI